MSSAGIFILLFAEVSSSTIFAGVVTHLSKILPSGASLAEIVTLSPSKAISVAIEEMALPSVIEMLKNGLKFVFGIPPQLVAL